MLVVAVKVWFDPFIDGKSSENTTESVSSLSFNTIGVVPFVWWLFKDNIMLDKPLFPIPNELPFWLTSF